MFCCCFFLFRLKKSNFIEKSVHKYTSGGTLNKLELEQPTVKKLETSKLLSLSIDGFQVLVNDNDVTLPNGDTVLNGAALLYCGDRLESNNAGTVDELLDEGVYHFDCFIVGGRIVTENTCETFEDAVVVLFLEDASAKKRVVNTSFSSMEVSAASSLPNEEFDVYDMRVPATNLTKDAPQLGKGKLTLTWKRPTVTRGIRVVC